MPQWRKLHVKAVESLDINDMPDDFTRLAWVLLPLALDSEGRGLDNPAWVKSNVFPLRVDVSLEMVTGAMDWFADRGMIERYQVGGRKYFYATNFEKYQDTKREAESKYPSPDDADKPILYNEEEVPTSSEPTPDLLPTSSEPTPALDIDVDIDKEKNSKEVGEPTPAGKKSKSVNDNGNHPHQLMFGAIAKTCKINYKIATAEQKGELNQTEKILRVEARASPEDIPDFEKWWYGQCWKGKKGDPPNPTQIREEWQKFIEYRADKVEIIKTGDGGYQV